VLRFTWKYRKGQRTI